MLTRLVQLFLFYGATAPMLLETFTRLQEDCKGFDKAVKVSRREALLITCAKYKRRT